MLTRCADLIGQMNSHLAGSLTCSETDGGYYVIATPFLYPDNDNIELFIRETLDGKVLITDFGQTMMKLDAYGFAPGSGAAKRRAMIFQITAAMGVRYEDGSVLVVTDPASAGERMWDVALTAQRLADLVFTVPAYTKATFTDEFESYAIEKRVPYKRGVAIDLPGYSFHADFVLENQKVVQLLSSSSVDYARERVDRVYTNFAEMRLANDTRERFAVIDDRSPVFDARMITLLNHQADRVLQWTRKPQLERAIVTAA